MRFTNWQPALLAVLVFAAIWLYGRERDQNGALQEQVRGLTQRNAALEDEAGRIDTVYRTDTLRLTITRRVTDSILRVDTLVPAHTVRQIVADERNACDAVIRTCEARVALRDLRIAVLDSLLRVKDKQRPGFLKRTFGCAVGVAATPQGAGLGGACGVKVF